MATTSKVNLVRNTKVFAVTGAALDSITYPETTGHTVPNSVKAIGADWSATNIQEIQVLDGISLSQNTATEVVTLNEAGPTPARGQRSFNTALDPAEFSFSTYIRPYKDGTTIKAEESVLWNCFATGYVAGGGAVTDAWDATASNISTLKMSNSNYHQFKPLALIMVIDNVVYAIDNCVLDQATIDFGLDAIATIAWTGRGARIRELTNVTLTYPLGVPTFNTNAVKAKVTSASYLANKLSAASLWSAFNLTYTGNASYTVPITGGSITLANNSTYLTPANLGVVNKPITYFSGTRAVSGSLNAYLRTGTTDSTDTGDLLKQLLDGSSTDISPTYSLKISIGGAHNAGTRVDLVMPAAVLSIPTINIEQVVTTTINFTAHSYSGGEDTVSGNEALDINAANEIEIRYLAA